MTYLRRINWPFTLACLSVAVSLACFAYQYLDLNYFSSSVVGLFGWIGAELAAYGENDETQRKA